MIELVRGMTKKVTPDGIPVTPIHYSADPERAKPEWKKAERKKYTSESKWQSEQEIIFGAGGGERLFAEILTKYAHKILIDPETSGFQPSPTWEYLGGFDYGKANPTAALIACVDFDGTIYILREYYQPGFSPRQHKPYLESFKDFSTTRMYADPSIFYKTQAQDDGSFKAIADMFREDGFRNLVPAPENNELLGMERILAHWMNLDTQEPTLKILCPKRAQDMAKPAYGIANSGCPNLLWELRRARRAELTPVQLTKQNPTEKIVDVDNHLRDCLKYLALTLPDPARKTPQMLAAEAVRPLLEARDLTSALIQHNRIMDREASYTPPRLGRYQPRPRRRR